MKTIIINFSGKDIAAEFGLTPPAVYQWFADKKRTLPTADKVAKLWHKFGIPPEYWAAPDEYVVKFEYKRKKR